MNADELLCIAEKNRMSSRGSVFERSEFGRSFGLLRSSDSSIQICGTKSNVNQQTQEVISKHLDCPHKSVASF